MAVDPTRAEFLPSIMSFGRVEVIQGGQRQMLSLEDTGYYDMASARYSYQFLNVSCVVICFSKTVRLYDERTHRIHDWVPTLHASIEKSFCGANGGSIVLVETKSDCLSWENDEEHTELQKGEEFTYHSKRTKKPIQPIFMSNKDLYKQFLEETNRRRFSFCNASVATPDGVLELLSKILEMVN